MVGLQVHTDLHTDENIYELDHAEEYEEPIYFFTPSIGISELTIYEGKDFLDGIILS